MKNLKTLLSMLIVASVLPLFGCSVADLPGNLSYISATEALDRRDYRSAFETLSNLDSRGGFHDATSVKVMLADLYLEGRGTKQDIAKGVSLLEQAGSSTSDLNWAVIAQNKLAAIYEDGKPPVIEKNLVAAASWYRKASRLGSDPATRGLARLLRDPSVYVELNPEEFTAPHSVSPGALDEAKRLIEPDPNRAFEICRWHARRGDPSAQFLLAKFFYSGIGTPKNKDWSMRWLFLAASNGLAQAQYTLANTYRDGDLLDISFDAYEKWLVAAVEQSHSDAMNDLGALRLHPLKRGRRSDPDAAFKLFEKAADLGNVYAITNLADLYSEGVGAQKDLVKARELYQKAAAAGNKVAQRRLNEFIGKEGSGSPQQVIIKERVIVEKALEVTPNAETIFNQNAGSVFRVIVGSLERRDGKLAVTAAGSGSAVAVSPKHALTNCHVVENKNVVLVVVGGKKSEGVVVHRDTIRDVCVLRISGVELQPVKKARSFEDLKIGEPVYAIGSPAGLENSISEGIISGKRHARGSSWIQTTAAISPGSSGGGLFDKGGNLIGITTFKIAGESDEGLNFAVPAQSFFEMAKRL